MVHRLVCFFALNVVSLSSIYFHFFMLYFLRSIIVRNLLRHSHYNQMPDVPLARDSLGGCMGLWGILNVNTPCGYELRQSARPKIRLPRIRLIFTESCLLYQLLKLINCTQTNNPEILEKIHKKTHTYFGFNFDVTRIYSSTYTYECTVPNCFKC